MVLKLLQNSQKNTCTGASFNSCRPRQDLRNCFSIFLKKMIHVNFAKLLRTSTFQNICERLVLDSTSSICYPEGVEVCCTYQAISNCQ